ncbi:hypothetical protein OIU89_26410 [Escherichia coli]|nr:hypothetical protein [Escherichia coli]
MNKGKGYRCTSCHAGNAIAMVAKVWTSTIGALWKPREPQTSPSDVVTGCIPPTHTYKDYLNAWTHFCTSQAVTDADRRIVRESVRPYSVVNPCKALK